MLRLHDCTVLFGDAPDGRIAVTIASPATVATHYFRRADLGRLADAAAQLSAEPPPTPRDPDGLDALDRFDGRAA